MDQVFTLADAQHDTTPDLYPSLDVEEEESDDIENVWDVSDMFASRERNSTVLKRKKYLCELLSVNVPTTAVEAEQRT